MSFDPWKQKLRPLNPLPVVMAADDPAKGFNATPEDFAREGYKVLDRADPQNPYNPSRPGLSEPVYDFPLPDPY